MTRVLCLAAAFAATAGSALAAGPTTPGTGGTTGTPMTAAHHRHLTPAEKAKLEALMKELRAKHAAHKPGGNKK